MKSVIFAAIALVGFTAAAPPAYHQYPKHYPAHVARDSYDASHTILPYSTYKTVNDYVPRAAAPAYGTVLPYLTDNLKPKRAAKPVPKYKQYKAPKYGSKKRQELPTTEVSSLDTVSEVDSLPIASRQELPAVPETDSTELPTSTVPEVGSIA